MGLIDDSAIQRVEVLDGWIDIKANLSIGAVLGMVQGRSLSALGTRTPETVTAMLNGGIVAWSYDEPLTPENIARLDFRVAAQVLNKIDDLFAGDPKKDRASSPRSNGAAGTKTSPISESSTA